MQARTHTHRGTNSTTRTGDSENRTNHRLNYKEYDGSHAHLNVFILCGVVNCIFKNEILLQFVLSFRDLFSLSFWIPIL